MTNPPLKSQVIEFYNDANIFITGATGFLGKSLVEKLLRVCTNGNHIYVLVRGKKGQSPQMRLKETFNEAVFDLLRQIKPDFGNRVTCVEGDVTLPKMGINEEMYEFLTKEITHVFHSAATVRFTEKLKSAVEINVIGLREIINFCDKCSQLKIFVHTSTAFFNYHGNDIVKEEFRDSPVTEENIVALMNLLTEEQLDAVTPTLIKPWPNTYCFTKIIAEDIIKNLVANYPVLVLRPSIVMGTVKEPVSGWVDNINGPTGILVGAGAGVLRVLWADKDAEANIVPVDMVVNAFLCSAWEVAKNFQLSITNPKIENNGLEAKFDPSQHNKKIYNIVARRENSFTWGDFLKWNLKHGIRYPMEDLMWFYTITLFKIKLFFEISFILFHWIPGFLMDVFLIILGKKPRLLRTYKKIYRFSHSLAYFCLRDWTFCDKNTRKLWDNLSETDKKIFPFDLSQVNWDDYFENTIKGIRLYLLKQKESTIPKARRKLFYFWAGHRIFQITFIALILWLIECLFLKFGGLSQKPLEETIVITQKLLGNSS